VSDGFDSRATCWTLIRSAAAGDADRRELFARQYESIVRAYLAHRWRGSPLVAELDDVAQEVFVECFRQGGVLDRLRQSEPDSFRGFLHGVTRNVALRCERRLAKLRERQDGTPLDADGVPADDDSLSQVFDRAWALAIVRSAARVQEERAKLAGAKAERRVELLRLRARENLPIRAIAARWNEDAALVHKEYARARREFQAALEEALSFHHPGLTAREIADRSKDILSLLGER